MACLTHIDDDSGECGFLAANLYAKSIFGEDALVNVSIEKQVRLLQCQSQHCFSMLIFQERPCHGMLNFSSGARVHTHAD
jgi:hypothetical protein